MPTILINRAFPDRRADLAGAVPTDDVIGYQATGNRSHNQMWNNVSVPRLDTTRIRVQSRTLVGITPVPVTVGVNHELAGQKVYGGGPNNNFVITFVDNDIMIRLAGTNLYWTLENGTLSARVVVMPLAGEAGGPVNVNQQRWTPTAPAA